MSKRLISGALWTLVAPRLLVELPNSTAAVVVGEAWRKVERGPRDACMQCSCRLDWDLALSHPVLRPRED